MKRLHVTDMDLCDLASSEARQDFLFDHRPIVSLRTGGLLRKMLATIALSQVGDGRRLPALAFLTRRIFAAIDAPAQLLGLKPRDLNCPFGEAPNR
ncbi:MAG: hypothetical protein WBS22_07225 [Methylocystis sp.]